MHNASRLVRGHLAFIGSIAIFLSQQVKAKLERNESILVFSNFALNANSRNFDGAVTNGRREKLPNGIKLNSVLG